MSLRPCRNFFAHLFRCICVANSHRGTKGRVLHPTFLCCLFVHCLRGLAKRSVQLKREPTHPEPDTHQLGSALVCDHKDSINRKNTLHHRDPKHKQWDIVYKSAVRPPRPPFPVDFPERKEKAENKTRLCSLWQTDGWQIKQTRILPFY